MCKTTTKVKSRQHLVKVVPKKPGVVPLGLECSIHVQRCAVDIWVDLMYSLRDILVDMLCASVGYSQRPYLNYWTPELHSEFF